MKTPSIMPTVAASGFLALGTACLALAQESKAPPAAPASASAMGLAVYPAKSQDAAQQAKDETECLDWSKAQAAAAPAPAPAAAAPEQQGPGGERIRGAARGAAAGAVIGEVANDDASEGAAAGAAAGVVAGGHRTRKARRDQQEQAAAQEQAKAQAAEQAKADAVKRSMAACLEGRGYTVK
jgi:hypothetical protein